MKCPSCQASIGSEARFCSQCGTKVRQTCARCQASIEVGAAYCGACGAAQAVSAEGVLQGERRQVTILFCDVVGSTKLTERVDVEDLHALWATFQHACISVVERYGGHIARFQGDGFIAYFGYPVAHEDAPYRGAKAALAVLQRIARLNQGPWSVLGEPVRMRTGLHTGQVVADALSGTDLVESANIAGMAPNIAARLEAFAAPDTIAVSVQTKRLIEDGFSFEPLGFHQLAGVEQPVEIFRLTGELDGTLSASTVKTTPDTLIDRDREVGTLVDLWRDVAGGGGSKMVRVIGEPGIGKSASLEAFLREGMPDGEQLVVLACSNLDQDSAFGPVMRMFQRAFDFSIEEEGARRARLIEAWLRARDFNEDRFVSAIVGLFVPDGEASRDQNADAREVRREIVAALTAWVSSRKRPILLVLEDAHWVDPSTEELIDRIWRCPEGGPGLFVEITRPGPVRPWEQAADATIRLIGLSRQGCEQLVRRVTAGVPVESEVLNHIIDRSDGVPLFVEELTRWVLASGQLVERNGRWRSTRDVSNLNIPASLVDSLTERLDGLGPAKRLAQGAAVLGTDFSLEELAAVADESGETLKRNLDRLIGSGFVDKGAQEREAPYRFHHVLYRRVAYDSMLRARRKALHSRYVTWLDEQPARQAGLRPEILALHCENAGLEHRAVEYWLEAGERDSRASASQEAEHHLTKGLEVLANLPDTVENKTQALKMNVLLGPVLMMNRGTGAPETSTTYDRALALCQDLPQTQWHFPAYWGWWRISENFRLMSERAEWLLEVVGDMHDPEYSLEAHHCRWVNSFMTGDHEGCFHHVKTGMEIYDSGRFDTLGTLYGGHDPKVCGVGDMALSLWLTGKPDTALKHGKEALKWGEQTGHLGSHLHGLDIAMMLHHYLRDTVGTRALAEELQTLGEQNDLDDYRIKGLIFQGWCSVEEGECETGAGRVAACLEVIRQTVTPEDYPVYFCMHAQAQTAIGNYDAAQKVLDEGLSMSEQQGLAYWTAELIRQSAETLIASGKGDLAAIDALLDCASQTARSQKALSLDLRTALSRARWRTIDDHDALDRLRSTVGQFTEGFETRDLREAARLLALAQTTVD